MSQIFNKSQHPVTVKRIPVRIWALRDEIEAALDRRIKECEAAGTPLFVDDIKIFYGMKTDAPLASQPQLQVIEGGAAATENVDQMMEALAPAAEAPAAQAAPVATPEPTSEPTPEPKTEAKTEATSEHSASTPAESTEPAAHADTIIASQTAAEKAEAPKAPHLQKPYERQAPDSDKMSYGFALLSDINMDWMLTFSKFSFIQGQSIVIEFLIPRPFTMSAEVVLCANYSMRSRIISDSKPDYRLQCRFTYLKAGERTRLRDFLSSIEPDLPKKAAAPKPAAEGAGPEA